MQYGRCATGLAVGMKPQQVASQANTRTRVAAAAAVHHLCRQSTHSHTRCAYRARVQAVSCPASVTKLGIIRRRPTARTALAVAVIVAFTEVDDHLGRGRGPSRVRHAFAAGSSFRCVKRSPLGDDSARLLALDLAHAGIGRSLHGMMHAAMRLHSVMAPSTRITPCGLERQKGQMHVQMNAKA